MSNDFGAQENVGSGKSKGRELRPFFQRNLTIKGKKEREKKEYK